jgi:REP element-mobilizing transposase RayT
MPPFRVIQEKCIFLRAYVPAPIIRYTIMAQSLAQVYLHIIFSTKGREALLLPRIQPELFAYLGGVCHQLDCPPIKIGGYLDHVHILCKLSRKVPIMRVVEGVKSNSSRWLKIQDELLSSFAWQNGYGAFSVSPTRYQGLVKYIANQHVHHQDISFQAEYREILKQHEIEFDEKYVWD